MKRFLPVCFLLMVLAAGCRLDPPVYPDIIDITATDLSTFFPTDKQATWEYEVEREGGKTIENHLLSGETVDIDGAAYYTVTINPATKEEIRYFSKADGLYKLRTIAPTNGENIELEYLKDDAHIGDSWDADLNAEKTFDGAAAGTETLIRETNITRVVLGKRYSSVTHTMVEVKHNIGDGMKTFAVYHFYVAKGIGIIEMSIDFENKTLATYQLKNFRLK